MRALELAVGPAPGKLPWQPQSCFQVGVGTQTGGFGERLEWGVMVGSQAVKAPRGREEVRCLLTALGVVGSWQKRSMKLRWKAEGPEAEDPVEKVIGSAAMLAARAA